MNIVGSILNTSSFVLPNLPILEEWFIFPLPGLYMHVLDA